MSLTVKPGGSDCFSLSAFSRSFTHRVYRYLEQRTLNFTTSFDFLILTAARGGRAAGEAEASKGRAGSCLSGTACATPAHAASPPTAARRPHTHTAALQPHRASLRWLPAPLAAAPAAALRSAPPESRRSAAVPTECAAGRHTHLASFLLAVSRKSLISLICLGCGRDSGGTQSAAAGSAPSRWVRVRCQRRTRDESVHGGGAALRHSALNTPPRRHSTCRAAHHALWRRREPAKEKHRARCRTRRNIH